MTLILRSLIILSTLLFACKKPVDNLSGLSWEVQESTTDASLRGLVVVSPTVAWASGSSGTFFRTIDGGINWKMGKVADSENLDFRDVHAWDGETALLLSAGRPGKIFKTTDGGKNWVETYSNKSEGVFFNAMDFWDDQNGIAISDPVNGRFLLIRTQDGGETWHAMPGERIPKPAKGEAQFAASGTCLTVYGDSAVWFATGGPVARVFRSLNRGKTWAVSETDMLHGASSQGIFSLTFGTSDFGLLVGGDYKNESADSLNAAFTEDSGKTWQIIGKNQPSGFRECVVPIPDASSNIWLAIGPSGSDLSWDNGKSWNPINLSDLHAVDFAPHHNVGWAVGKNGKMVKLSWRASE